MTRHLVVSTPFGEWEGEVSSVATAQQVVEQVVDAVKLDRRDFLELAPWAGAPCEPDFVIDQMPDCKYWIILATGNSV